MVRTGRIIRYVNLPVRAISIAAQKLQRAADRAIRYMYDTPPNESAYVLGMFGSYNIPRKPLTSLERKEVKVMRALIESFSVANDELRNEFNFGKIYSGWKTEKFDVGKAIFWSPCRLNDTELKLMRNLESNGMRKDQTVSKEALVILRELPASSLQKILDASAGRLFRGQTMLSYFDNNGKQIEFKNINHEEIFNTLVNFIVSEGKEDVLDWDKLSLNACLGIISKLVDRGKRERALDYFYVLLQSNFQRFYPSYTIQLARKIMPHMFELEGLSLILRDYEDHGMREKDNDFLVWAGALYRQEVQDKIVCNFLAKSLLELGQILCPSSQVETKGIVAFYKKVRVSSFWPRICDQLARLEAFGKIVEALWKEGFGLGIKDIDLLRGYLYEKTDGLREFPELKKRIEEDQNYLRLLPWVAFYFKKNPLSLALAHFAEDDKDMRELNQISVMHRESLRHWFKTEQDLVKKLKLYRILDALGERDYDFVMQIATLLNRDDLSEEVRKQIESVAYSTEAKRLAHYGKPEEIPDLLRKEGKVIAEKAHRSLEALRTISRRTKKPIISIYILSTAKPYNIERHLDCYYKDEAVREEAYEKLKPIRLGKFEEEVAAVDASRTPEERVQNQIKFLEAMFYETVKDLEKASKLNRRRAILSVAKSWIEWGLLSYFSYPVEIKIPSSSEPPLDARQELETLAKLAQKVGCEIALIDDSTLRTKEFVEQAGYPKYGEHGRAIARGMQIFEEVLKEKCNLEWWYKDHWDVEEVNLSLESSRPNIVGINLYTGKVYDKHVPGRKEWAFQDDRATVMGGHFDRNGERHDRVAFMLIESQRGVRARHLHTYLQSVILSEVKRLDKQPLEQFSLPAMNILFVCNANHHRSPMAQLLTERILRSRYGPEAEKVCVFSAGLDHDGYVKKYPEREKMSKRVAKLLRGLGIEAGDFEKKQISETDVLMADQIFVMTKRERDVLIERFPQAASKVHILKEFIGFAEAEADLPTPSKFDNACLNQFEDILNRVIDRIITAES